jgi:hypothetical protein
MKEEGQNGKRPDRFGMAARQSFRRAPRLAKVRIPG